MSGALALSPVLVPLATALGALLCRERPRAQRGVSLLGSLLFLACGVALVAATHAGGAPATDVGGWLAPFGVRFAVDGVSAALVLVTAILGLVTIVHLESDVDPPVARGEVRPLVHGLLAGVGGAFATADLFNLYVWFELMLICALGLLAAGGARKHLEATTSYLVLNLLGTLLLLLGVGLVYGASGQLAFAAIAASDFTSPTHLAVVGVLLFALLTKSGGFPIFAWLPASYPTLPVAVLALFAGLLTKVGVYGVFRASAHLFAPLAPPLAEALGWIAVVTMITGVLGAAYHYDVRRILAFHIVSQIGYILLAIAIGTRAAMVAALFYTVHHIFVKANLFLVGGFLRSATGTWDLRRSGGVFRARPALAALFAVPALSLVGIPPSSGFWSKWLVLDACFDEARWAWGAAALAVSVLTLYSMSKVWLEAFWRPAQEPTPSAGSLATAAAGSGAPGGRGEAPAVIASVALALCTLTIGLHPQLLLGFVERAVAALGGP